MEITGYSISEYIDHINKSGCGYVPSSTFRFRSLGKGIDELNPEENVSPNLISSAVDCMTHFMSGSPAMLAFGNKPFVARHIGGKSLEFKAVDLIKTGITGLDDQSIINAVKLSGFDPRFLVDTESYQPIEEINPDEATIQNVRTMVERSLHVFEIYGPKFLDRFDITGGYTDTAKYGVIDFMTPDTIWDFEVSKTRPTQGDWLRLLMNWRKALRLPCAWLFQDVNYLGIYNPRLDEVYWIRVCSRGCDC